MGQFVSILSLAMLNSARAVPSLAFSWMRNSLRIRRQVLLRALPLRPRTASVFLLALASAQAVRALCNELLMRQLREDQSFVRLRRPLWPWPDREAALCDTAGRKRERRGNRQRPECERRSV